MVVRFAIVDIIVTLIVKLANLAQIIALYVLNAIQINAQLVQVVPFLITEHVLKVVQFLGQHAKLAVQMVAQVVPVDIMYQLLAAQVVLVGILNAQAAIQAVAHIALVIIVLVRQADVIMTHQ